MANQINFGNMSTWGTTNWIRRAKVLLAASVLGLIGACGGGGVSAPTTVGGDLQVLPGTTDMFADTPVTFTISGGSRPYTAFSSNSSLLPLNITISSGTTFVATAKNPSTDTNIDITVRDSQGKTATATARIKTSVLLNSIEISSSTNSGNACGGADVCTGADAVAKVRAQSNGGPLVGRSIRFDVTSGAILIFSGSGTATTSSVTVAADSSGYAIVRLTAPVGAPSQYSTIRATDVLSGQTTSYVLKVGQTIDPTAIKVIPDTVTWTGAFNDSCASSSATLTNFLVTGGTAPYIIQQSVPNHSTIVGVPPGPVSLIPPPGGVTMGSNAATGPPGGSLLIAFTGRVCGDNTISIVDAIGRVASFKVVNNIGTAVRPTAPTAPTLPAPVLTPNTFASLGCGVSFSSFVSQTIPDGYTGTAPILSATSLEPTRISASLSNGIVTVQRLSSDPGGGGQSVIRVSNGVSFADLTVTFSGASPFSCAGSAGGSTPISVGAGTTLTLNCPAGAPAAPAACGAVGPAVATTFDGGTGPYTIAVAAPNLAEISVDGATYSQTITVPAGSPKVYFARAMGAAVRGQVTFVTIRDSSTTQQTLVQVININ